MNLTERYNEAHLSLLSLFLLGLLGLRAAVEDGLEDDSVFSAHQGVCYGVSQFLYSAFNPRYEEFDAANEAWRRLRDSLFEAWPEFSGSVCYPVPGNGECDHDEECEETEEEYRCRDAEYAYDTADNMWDGEYGARRMRLLQYMIDQIMSTVTSIKEKAPTPVTAASYKPAHGGYPGVVR